MSSIDVLLQAADFLERQQQFSSLSSSYESASGGVGGGSTSSSLSSASSRVVSLSPYFLASSSLSPPLSSASSTSSSCFGSPSGSRGTATTDNNTSDHLLSSSSSSTSPLEIKHFHKKFSPSKGLDPQVLTSKFSFSSSQSNGNAASSSSPAAYHNVLYPSPSSSISSDCSNSGSGFGGSSSSSSSSSGTKLKLKTNSHSGIVSGGPTACSSSSLDRLDDAKRDKALHNTLEKNRRAHLKDCFENLQNELPQYKEKKATNLAILNYTVKYIDACHRKNRDFEREKAMLLKRQNLLKQALEQLVTDIKMNDKDFDLKKWQATSASSSTSYNSGANDLKSDYLSKVDLQMKSTSSSVNAVASFASDYLDDSTASTSTASEANDYATIDSRAKRNIIHNKSSGASSSLKPLVSLKYQRKRSSNSLNLPSINIGNIHMNNKPPVIATKIIKLDEHPAASQQVKLSSRGGSGVGGGQAQNHRQRHYSVDESMIKSKQRKRQINICDETIEDELLEDDEDEEDEEFDYEYEDEDEEMSMDDEMEDNDDSENELVINEDANTTTATVTLAPAPAQKIVKLQTFSRSISNNSNESSSMFHSHQQQHHRSSPTSLDITNGSIKSSSSLNGNLENLKLVLNENTTRHSQKPILSLNASNGVAAQYIITSNQNNNTSNSVTGGGNKQIQIINKSTATTTTTSSSNGGHTFNHPSLQVKHHPYSFTTTTTSSNTNTQQNQHLTDSALKYQINVGQK